MGVELPNTANQAATANPSAPDVNNNNNGAAVVDEPTDAPAKTLPVTKSADDKAIDISGDDDDVPANKDQENGDDQHADETKNNVINVDDEDGNETKGKTNDGKGKDKEDDDDDDEEEEEEDDDDDDDDDDDENFKVGDAEEDEDDEGDDEDDEEDDEDDDGANGDAGKGKAARMSLPTMSAGMVAQFISKERIASRALHDAATNDDVETIEKLLTGKSDKGEGEGDGNENENGKEEKENEDQIDVDATDPYQYTALHKAAESGSVNAVRKLISFKASLESKTRMHECRPLHYAALYGHDEVIDALAEAGSDVNARTDDGRTPLMQAAIKGHAACVKVLLKHGADVSIANEEGKKPADVATDGEVIELLEGPPEKKARTE